MRTASYLLIRLLAVAWVVFASTPLIGVWLSTFGYPETGRVVLLAFFHVLAWTGGLS